MNAAVREASHRSFLRWLRTAWECARKGPRFRDPWADFRVSATDAQALLPTPPFRPLHGPYLLEHGPYVSLYLGGSTTDGVHAVMDCRAPHDLVFSYTKIMAGFCRFRPMPRTIGMLGLGGGSLAKHCYAHFPQSRIVVAEISPEVIGLRRRFLVPNNDDRFSVLQVDGAELVGQSANAFDVLLIDAFDEGGTLPHLGTRRFYRACRRALTTHGVLAINFSGEAWKTCSRRLNAVFRKQTVLYQCPDGDNVIAFATKARLPAWTSQRLGPGA